MRENHLAQNCYYNECDKFLGYLMSLCDLLHMYHFAKISFWKLTFCVFENTETKEMK